MQLFFLCYVKASFFSTVRFCFGVTRYNFMGSNCYFHFSCIFTVAVSKGKNLLPYELILSLTSCAPVETGKNGGNIWHCTHTE